jgi:hypothetical protein
MSIISILQQCKAKTLVKKKIIVQQKSGMTIATMKDLMKSTREALSEMIYYYMETPFPPLLVRKVEDIPLGDVLSNSDVIKDVTEQLKIKQLQPEYVFPEFSSINDYLSKKLVCKLEITGSNEGYDQISLIGALCSCYFCHYIFCEGYVIYIQFIFGIRKHNQK